MRLAENIKKMIANEIVRTLIYKNRDQNFIFIRFKKTIQFLEKLCEHNSLRVKDNWINFSVIPLAPVLSGLDHKSFLIQCRLIICNSHLQEIR